MPEAIRARVERAIREKVFPGCIVGIVRKDGERMLLPFGRFTYEDTSEEVSTDSVYDVASITKSIPTASLASLSIEEKKLALDALAKNYLPELHNDRGATIEDLLRYRVHGAQLSKLPYTTFEEIRTHALERGFDTPPGASVYTNLPAFILGLILERVADQSLAPLAHERLFGPLHMQHTTFFPAASDCAPTEIDGRGEVRGLPHDESAYVFALKRRAVGHAGLFSTAPDLLTFLEGLLRGELGSIAEGAEMGLGWQTEGAFLGSQAKGRFGKSGFTGASIACDTGGGTGLVILSNRTYPKRPSDNSAVNSLRCDIADIVFGS